jgi:SAM-dependent methyltransferase
MISERLLALVRCPDCQATLEPHPADAGRIVCSGCQREFLAPAREYLDLRPRSSSPSRRSTANEALHADARHERVSPPLLGSKIRNDMLLRFLNPRGGDLVLDLGCGSGRTLLWNRVVAPKPLGSTSAPISLKRRGERCRSSSATSGGSRLAMGRSRRLVARRARALVSEALAGMLREAERVLAPGGALFVYTHVRKNAPIAMGLRGINRLARWLERGA